MAWGKVQSNSGTSGSISFSANVQAGDLLFILASAATIVGLTVSNTGTCGAQTWNNLSAEQGVGSNVSVVFWAKASAGGSCNITVGGLGSGAGVTIAEFSSSNPAISIDQSANANSGSSVTSYTQAINATGAGELVVCGFNGTPAQTLSLDSSSVSAGWASISGGVVNQLLAFQLNSVSGSNPAKCNASASGEISGIIGSFNPARGSIVNSTIVSYNENGTKNYIEEWNIVDRYSGNEEGIFQYDQNVFFRRITQ